MENINNTIKRDFQEVGRKILHIMIGTAALLMIIYNIMTLQIIFLLLIIFSLFSLFSLRYEIPVAHFFLNNFEIRGKNQLPGKGLLFAILGTLLVLQLFERDIALASIIILVFADPISYLFGKYFGKTKHFLDERKNIEGNIVGLIVSSAFALPFVSPILAIAGASVAMLFETLIIEIQKIELDDNLMIPLAAGTAMFLIRTFLM